MSVNHAQSRISQLFSDIRPANYYSYTILAADLLADSGSRFVIQLMTDIAPLANYYENRNTGRYSSRYRLRILKILLAPDSPAKALTAT